GMETASDESDKEAVKEEKEEFGSPGDLDEEDLELLSGFVSESLDGLDAIEVSLIDLEQEPDDTESINSIFRSFHTIKGISGFLNLMRINKLAHKAENLLDKVRGGEIAPEQAVVDIILESGDLLKKLILGVQDGLGTGANLDIGLDINPLVKRIDEIEQQADRLGSKPVGEILVEKGELSSDDLEQGLK
ncbi:MAG: chemotaxis protein CheA, partial [Proteobacteria bacterium]|nr:chemotaxis protein CheA [Pseudomonadota bacterium]